MNTLQPNTEDIVLDEQFEIRRLENGLLPFVEPPESKCALISSQWIDDAFNRYFASIAELIEP